MRTMWRAHSQNRPGRAQHLLLPGLPARIGNKLTRPRCSVSLPAFEFQSSSMVEHAAVNRRVAGSSPASGAISFLHNFLPDVLFVLEPGEDDLAVAFLKAGAAFGREGVGAAGAADAGFVLGRL